MSRWVRQQEHAQRRCWCVQPRPPAGSGRGDWSELAQACQSEQAGQVARQVGARATPFVRAQPPTDRPASGQQAARERTCNTASPEGAHPPHLPTGPLSAGAGVKRGVGSHLRGGALSARRPGPPSAKALLLYAGKKNRTYGPSLKGFKFSFVPSAGRRSDYSPEPQTEHIYLTNFCHEHR